jgi:two-component system, NtrC family, response regulator AtoC
MNSGCKILIIDDNRKLCESLARSFQDRDYDTCWAVTREEALDLFSSRPVSAALLDVRFGKETGLDVLRCLKERKPHVPVIMITAYGTVETAVESLKMGAFDYIQKPIQFERLLKQVENAVRDSCLESENLALRGLLDRHVPRLVTVNQTMKEICETARRIAISELPVLIYGETGTGKELLAELIHASSPRASRQMMKINCAAFPDSLLDNEMFGHEKGSFTGATGSYKGIFEKAHRSSIFLDELSTMALSGQAKLLRIIQNQEIRRIGGNETIKVDVRFVTATNEDPHELVQKGVLRKDLYYRLSSAVLRVPPLRERTDDIPLLAEAFLGIFSDQSPSRWTISPRVMEGLCGYEWPGNIRELKSVVQYAHAVSSDDCIDFDDLPPSFPGIPAPVSVPGIRSTVERNLILKTLRETNFNKKRAAQILSMSRATLYNKLEKYGIEKTLRRNAG